MNMNEVTFKMDCNLNDNEDWIAAGTKVAISDRYNNRKKDTTWVIIKKAFSFEGKEIELNEHVEFMNVAFKEEL